MKPINVYPRSYKGPKQQKPVWYVILEYLSGNKAVWSKHFEDKTSAFIVAKKVKGMFESDDPKQYYGCRRRIKTYPPQTIQGTRFLILLNWGAILMCLWTFLMVIAGWMGWFLPVLSVLCMIVGAIGARNEIKRIYFNMTDKAPAAEAFIIIYVCISIFGTMYVLSNVPHSFDIHDVYTPYMSHLIGSFGGLVNMFGSILNIILLGLYMATNIESINRMKHLFGERRENGNTSD